MNPDTFIRAAQLIEDGLEEFACNALIKTCNPNNEWDEYTAKPYIDFLLTVFPPCLGISWFPSDCHPASAQDCRVIGLHLCAELVSSGFTISDFPPSN